MVSTIAKSLANRFLADYLEVLDDNAVRVGLWGGKLVLRDVAVRSDMLSRKMGIPLVIEEGRVGRLTISIPWGHLSSRPVVVELQGLHVAARPFKLQEMAEEEAGEEEDEDGGGRDDGDSAGDDDEGDVPAEAGAGKTNGGGATGGSDGASTGRTAAGLDCSSGLTNC